MIADKMLINDVLEQKGGGGEPFTDVINKPRLPIEFVAKVAQDTRENVTKLAETTASKAKDTAKDIQTQVQKVADITRKQELSGILEVPEHDESSDFTAGKPTAATKG